MRVEFHPEAQTEFIESALYYEERIPGPRYRFIVEIEYYSRLLQSHPGLGQMVENQFRHLVLVQFPYSLIYTIESECIWVVAVAHHHKRHGYWHVRI
jgi:plasmid stabilization system protein ParE